MFVLPLRQLTHSRHWGLNSVTTWSPGRSELHVLADGLDHAGALVAEHAWGIARGVDPRCGVHVRVADAARVEADKHLPGLRLAQVELLHDERLGEPLQDRRPDLHG